MKIKNIKITLDGREYKWDWKKWIDLESYMIPSLEIINKLDNLLNNQPDLMEYFTGISNVYELNKIASDLKDSNNYVLSRRVIDIILTIYPHNSYTLAILCSLLRKQGKPREAIDLTNSYENSNAALFTSRAAAFCDLDEWQQAKKEVGKALAMTSNYKDKQEAFNVVARIRIARPDLY